jgi:hypothetical protein
MYFITAPLILLEPLEVYAGLRPIGYFKIYMNGLDRILLIG